jgi:hypothetical protein
MWQTLETKARFIAQVMTGESDLRRIEDIDGAALTYAEVKAIASGNPMVIEKAGIDAEVARLTRLRTQHLETQFRLRSQVRHHTEEVPRLERRLEEVRRDIAARQDTRGDTFVMVIEGQTIRDRGIAGELLLRLAERVKATRTNRQAGHFAGFQVVIAHNFMTGADIVIRGAGTHTANVGSTALGTIRSVEYAVQNLEEVAAGLEQRIAEARKRIFDLEVQTGQPFEYERKLITLAERQREVDDALDLTKNQVSAQLGPIDSADAAENATSLESGDEIPEGAVPEFAAA